MYFLLLSIVLSNEEICCFDVAMQLEKVETKMILIPVSWIWGGVHNGDGCLAIPKRSLLESLVLLKL